MIFKTITNELGTTKIAINDRVKNLFNGKLFEKRSILSNDDLNALKAYNVEIERGESPMTAYYRTMQDDMVEEFSEEIVGEDEEGNPIIEKQSLGFFKHPRINPAYNPEKAYVNRSDRPEWSAVGMFGKLYVRDDGTCRVNGYVTVGENGIATVSSEKTNMRVLSRVNGSVIRVLLR